MSFSSADREAVGGCTFSHLVHSESQLETRLVGQQMMMRRAMGLPPINGWPRWSMVHSSVMPCTRHLKLR